MCFGRGEPQLATAILPTAAVALLAVLVPEGDHLVEL